MVDSAEPNSFSVLNVYLPASESVTLATTILWSDLLTSIRCPSSATNAWSFLLHVDVGNGKQSDTRTGSSNFVPSTASISFKLLTIVGWALKEIVWKYYKFND